MFSVVEVGEEETGDHRDRSAVELDHIFDVLQLLFVVFSKPTEASIVDDEAGSSFFQS